VGVLAATAAAAASAAVCAAVGALAVASTGAAPAALVLKLEIVALNNLQHDGAKEEVLPVLVQLQLFSLPKSIKASKSKRGSQTNKQTNKQTNVHGETLYSD